MKKALERKQRFKLYHLVNGVAVDGAPPDLRGVVSGLSGNATGLRGDVFGLFGEVTGIYGDATGVTGYIDECGLTPEERRAGVDIGWLVKRTEHEK